MPVIAVVNRKGGSGKSTLATHLAGYYANAGVAVMLGDVDRQQSTQSWLRSRNLHSLPRSAPIVGWAVDPKRVLRPPPGVRHVILDTPGGLRGFDLARVAAFADVILMPVCNSAFDRESAADCYAELMTLPRVASGRCKIAAVGMRLDARTRSAEVLEAWARGLKLPFVGVLREAQVYVRCVETRPDRVRSPRRPGRGRPRAVEADRRLARAGAADVRQTGAAHQRQRARGHPRPASRDSSAPSRRASWPASRRARPTPTRPCRRSRRGRGAVPSFC